jgi:hypothetical protein
VAHGCGRPEAANKAQGHQYLVVKTRWLVVRAWPCGHCAGRPAGVPVCVPASWTSTHAACASGHARQQQEQACGLRGGREQNP